MKYGESTFDVLYLAFAIISGCVMLRRAKNGTEKRMGLAALILGCGDAFHLVPRVLNYFISADLTAALGIGKLITSVTMTVFYVLLYRIGTDLYGEPERRGTTSAVIVCAAVRIVLCLFPQNGWLENSSPLMWAILRNVPFAALGAIVCLFYYGNRTKDRRFGRIWLWILLSFAFYIPVAVGAGALPMLGMLMLPKTICYVLMILVFLRAVTGAGKAENRPGGAGA